MKFGEKRAALSETVQTVRSATSSIKAGVICAMIISVIALVVSIFRTRG
jgi:hypothetical protein